MARVVADRQRWWRVLTYLGVGLGIWLFSLVVVQTLLGRRIARAEMTQLGADVAFSLRLGELALEHYSMETVAELGGLQLAAAPPAGPAQAQREALELYSELCGQLGYCRQVKAAQGQFWVEMVSPLEQVWLATPYPRTERWPPDPLSLGLSLVAAGLALSTLVLTLEVSRPLRHLQASLQQLGLGERPQPLPERGAVAIRKLTRRFNTLVQQLEQGRQERETMLAGIGHDLNSPLTRLNLRLHLAESAPLTAEDIRKAQADLQALERITRQFIAFARGESGDRVIELDLAALLAEVAGQCHLEGLELELQPLHLRVQPTGLARALTNLLENARSHGAPPYRLALRPWQEDGFEIEVSDRGDGVPEALWPQALQPFRRLDEARSGSGHCGLGLAIAERVARSHHGELHCQRALASGRGFSVFLRGRSIGTPSQQRHRP